MDHLASVASVSRDALALGGRLGRGRGCTGQRERVTYRPLAGSSFSVMLLVGAQAGLTFLGCGTIDAQLHNIIEMKLAAKIIFFIEEVLCSFRGIMANRWMPNASFVLRFESRKNTLEKIHPCPELYRRPSASLLQAF